MESLYSLYERGQKDGERLMKAAILAKFDEWIEVCTAGNSLALRFLAKEIEEMEPK